VHTAGPFQGQDYRVAEACIAARTHYGSRQLPWPVGVNYLGR
jgi:hypothetical protein